MNEIDFIGIGAGRSGTTWIVEMLADHPEICMPLIKKTHYFVPIRRDSIRSEYDERGIQGYLELFKHCEEKKGEFSSFYMPNPKAAMIIQKHFPNVKIWACIREPVNRAYSDWLACKRDKLKENEDFKTAFFRERNSVYPNNDGYRNRGYYYKQLKPYFDLFPRKNIKIILHDELIKDSRKVLKELFKFIGVDSSFIPKKLDNRPRASSETKFKFLRKAINFLAELSHEMEKKFGKVIFLIKRKTGISDFFNKINEVNLKKSDKPKLDSKLKKELIKVYIVDINKLEKLINRDLSSWKK